MPEGHDFRTAEMSHEAPEDSGATKEMDKKMEKRTNMFVMILPPHSATYGGPSQQWGCCCLSG